MSLNDPRWGRNNSEEDKPKTEESEKTTNTSREEPSSADRSSEQEPRNDRDKQQEPPELEELWRQFNDRLNSLLGDRSKSKARKNTWGQKSQSSTDDQDTRESTSRSTETDSGQGGGFTRYGGRGGFSGNEKTSGAFAGIALAIAIGAWLASGFYIVPEGQTGVVTTFGAYSESSQAGFRWHMPWPIQDVDLVDVSSVRKAEIGIRGRPLRLKEALMLTDDENIVDVQFNVQYRIKDGPGAKDFLFKTRDPMGSVLQAAESAMREVVGRKKMDSVLFESKQEIAEEVKKRMQEMLDRYQSGIQILSVAIQNAQPPEQVQAAFNDAVKAGQDRERQINEGEAYANDVIPKAKGLAERLRQEAEGYKARVVSQAEGDASRFSQVLDEYKRAPKVTRDRMYVDAMQQVFDNTSKIMVDNRNASNLLYLPLDKLIEKTQSAPKEKPLVENSMIPAQSAAISVDSQAGSAARGRDSSRSLSREGR